MTRQPRRELGGAPVVCLDPLGKPTAVKLDHRLERGTRKIGDASSEAMLLAKPQLRDAFAHGPPEYLFDVRIVSTHVSRDHQPHRQPHLTLPLPPQAATAFTEVIE